MFGAKARAFFEWYSLRGLKKRRQARLSQALQHWKSGSLGKAWCTWTEQVVEGRKRKKAALRWKNSTLGKGFYGWLDAAYEMQRRRRILKRVVLRWRNQTLSRCFRSWWDEVEYARDSRMQEGHGSLLQEVEHARAENARLRRDNERLVRIIDSGEWGRGRVQELLQAGDILKGEREAMLKLISTLRREYDALQLAKERQEEEIQQLKQRFLTTGHARNVMLVKGASSFNSLVRAMKQDVVAPITAAPPARRDPNILYEIDKLSLDKVAIFPDGEMKVQAVASAAGPLAGNTARRPASAARLRPGSAAPASRGAGIPDPEAAGPLQRARVPEALKALRSELQQQEEDDPMGRLQRFSGGQIGGGSRRFGDSGAGPSTASAARMGSHSPDDQQILESLRGMRPEEITRLQESLLKQRQDLGGPGGAAAPGGAPRPPPGY